MKRHLHLYIFLSALFAAQLCTPGRLAAQANDFAALFSLFKKAATFDYDFPREKVYVHMDNNAYQEGDTLWFKAYVVRASSLKPEPLSRVLYAELLNADGSLVQRHLLRIDSAGGAAGQFILSLPVRRGYYEVRSYTREMTNWGSEACFSRVVPVFERRAEADGTSDLNIYKPEQESDLMPRHPRPYHFGRSGDVRLQLFPEGGSRVEGLAQVIAYKLTDGRGAPLDEAVSVVAGGEVVAHSRPVHEGMGHFLLPGNASDAYVEVSGKRFSLPAAGGGDYVIHVEPAAADGTTSVIVQRRAEAAPRLLGLAVTCREEVCYFDTLTVDAAAVQLDLPAAAFRGGVNRLELFDATGHSLARRLLWRGRARPGVSLRVLQNAAAYDAFAPVALELYATDAQGRPVQTRFSLAVRDAAGQLTGSTEDAVQVDMLLSSELRGYVHRPGWYFRPDVPQTRRLQALDDLLLVQGWSANPFSVMNGTDTFRLKQPIEDKLTLNGHVYRDNDKRQPYPGLDLSLKMYTRTGGALEGEARTDSLGAFAFQSNVDYYGDWIAMLTTRNERGKKKWSRVALDRWFVVPPRAYAYEEFQLVPPAAASDSAIATSPTPETFTWVDTLERFVPTDLAQATVTRQHRYRGLTGGRYTYNGGERAGMRKADIYYNIEREVEILKDRGDAVGTIWDLLASIDDAFDYDHSLDGYDPVEGNHAYADQISSETLKREGSTDPGVDASTMSSANGPVFDYQKVMYKNRTIADVFLNNQDNNYLLANVIWADEIKSVVIMHGRAKWQGFASDLTKVGTGDDAVFLYERPDYMYFQTKRGVDKRMVQGYTQPLPFAAPSYNGLDLPNDADLRRTLYWNPDVTTDEQGKATAVFFSNARPDVRLSISARGVTSAGQFIDYER